MKKNIFFCLAAFLTFGASGQIEINSSDIQFSVESYTLCVGQEVQFTDNTLNGPTTWSWTFEGGTPHYTNDQNPVVTYTVPGNYNIILAVDNSADHVAIRGFANIMKVVDCTGLGENVLGSVDLYPNPTSGRVSVTSDVACSFEVFDLLGRPVELRTIEPGATEIDLSSQPRGVYLFRFSSGAQAKTLRVIRH